jgi:multimeric flavodoxin WrbA
VNSNNRKEFLYEMSLEGERGVLVVKKICMLLGSPRRGGNSETMAEALVSGIGAETMVDRFRLGDMTIDGCMDCRKCWSTGRPCIIDDEMDKVYDSISESYALILATPLYWYSWSSHIKPVVDRFLPFLAEDAVSNLTGKKALLVASAGDIHASCFDGLLFSFRQSCGLLGMEVAGEFCYTDMYKKHAAAEDENLLAELKETGKKILS